MYVKNKRQSMRNVEKERRKRRIGGRRKVKEARDKSFLNDGASAVDESGTLIDSGAGATTGGNYISP